MDEIYQKCTPGRQCRVGVPVANTTTPELARRLEDKVIERPRSSAKDTDSDLHSGKDLISGDNK